MISLPADPRDREERLARVRRYLAALGLVNVHAIVFGSVGRGDFTVESDTDLLIVSNELPADLRARLDPLFSMREIAPEVEPIGWREDDWRRREREGDAFLAVLKREGIQIAVWRHPPAFGKRTDCTLLKLPKAPYRLAAPCT